MNRMRLAALGIIGVCGLLLDASSIHARTWSSRAGNYSVDATYVEIQSGQSRAHRFDHVALAGAAVAVHEREPHRCGHVDEVRW